MLTQPQQQYYTPKEYLELEETAEYKSEYIDGRIVPMAGASLNHNRLILNFSLYLKPTLTGKDYEVFLSDVRLWIPRYRIYTYPDVMLIAGEPVLQENRNDTVTNPSIIVEVLSKSTKNYDQGDKFDYYRSIPEFREYVLIDQYKVNVKHFAKTSESQWLLTNYESTDAMLSLSALEFQIQLSEIYEGIKFENSEE